MKIEKRGNSYRIQKMIKGKKHSITFDHKPSKKEVDEAIANLYAGDTSVKLSEAHRETFKTCADEYISVNESPLSPATIRGYKSIVKNTPEWFLCTKVGQIDRLTVQKVVNEYGGTHSAKSTKNFHGFISAVLKMFYPELVLNTNLPQDAKIDGYIPTSDDIAKILHLAEKTRYFVPYRLATYGLRRGEICALVYPDDFDGNMVHISKSLVEDSDHVWHVKGTKTTASDRTIYIDDELLSRIKEQGCVYDGFPGRLTSTLRTYQDRLDLPHFRLHDFRHYFATEMSEMGIPEADILAMGGWAKGSDTMKRVYRHQRLLEDIDRQKQIAEQLRQKIEKPQH